jgi:putative heme-binding domain-containing protein
LGRCFPSFDALKDALSKTDERPPAFARSEIGIVLDSLLLGNSERTGKKLSPAADDKWLGAIVTGAAGVAVDESRDAAERLICVRLLGWINSAAPRAALLRLAPGEKNAELRTAAIRALVTFDAADVASTLLAQKRWSAILPAEREITLSALLARPAHVPRVLEAVESGVVSRNAVSAAQRTALSKSKDAAVRDRAAKLFGAPADGDRMKAYEAAKAVLALAPKAAHGKEVFKTLCASCHRLNQEGYNVGPDLLGMRNQPKESILLHIVVPDYEVITAFAASNVELKDGRILAGIIISDTPESVTLRQALGVEENIPRANIKSLTASEHSLMPGGLEATMKPQDLADLLSFLKGESQ